MEAEVGHPDMSRRLLERWQLPAWLGECAGRHHDEDGDAAVIATPRLDPAAETELLRGVIDEVGALTQALGAG